MAKCSLCHAELPSPRAICTGRKPGPLGLVEFSPGKCLSTPLDRAEMDRKRTLIAARDAERP